MPPEPRDVATSARMKKQGQRDTRAELLIRRRLHALGFRFRVDRKPEPSMRTRGDLIFTRQRVVVFVDGCFWHACPQHRSVPRTNSAWWKEKLAANVMRDERATQQLQACGWTVVRIWEHENTEAAVDQIIEAVGSSHLRKSRASNGGDIRG